MTAIQKRRTAYLFIGVAILLIPLVAMQFSKEVNWTILDFSLAGALLFGIAITLKWIIKKAKTKRAKLMLISALLIVFILLWIELAVGIFNSPIAGN